MNETDDLINENFRDVVVRELMYRTYAGMFEWVNSEGTFTMDWAVHHFSVTKGSDGIISLSYSDGEGPTLDDYKSDVVDQLYECIEYIYRLEGSTESIGQIVANADRRLRRWLIESTGPDNQKS